MSVIKVDYGEIGGSTDCYVTINYSDANYSMAYYDGSTETLQAARCDYAGNGTTRFETPILTIQFLTTHTFTVTYTKNCTANGTAKTAGSSENITYTGMPINWVG